MIRTLRGVGKTAIRGHLCSKTVNAAWTPGDLGALHFLPSGSTKIALKISKYIYLNGSYTTKSPKITIGNPWELLLDLLHEVTSDVQAGVGSVYGLGLETHGGVIAIRDGVIICSVRVYR